MREGTLHERLDGLLEYGDPPVVIVTARSEDDKRIAGCLVGFMSQCAITPARFALWLSVENYTYEVASSAQYLAAHVLTSQDQPLAELFGSITGREHDKFLDCAWQRGPHRLPILATAGGWFAGPVEHHPPSGDHALFIMTPDVVEGRLESKPLSFQDVKHIRAGNPA